jgi:hypothetical protein
MVDRKADITERLMDETPTKVATPTAIPTMVNAVRSGLSSQCRNDTIRKSATIVVRTYSLFSFAFDSSGIGTKADRGGCDARIDPSWRRSKRSGALSDEALGFFP